MTHKRISVCLASYNGERYIEEQLQSILMQLDDLDEIIVVDDASSDGTTTVIESFTDPRIRLIVNSRNIGYVASFEKAITISSGNFVMLSDQDDIWLPGRVEILLNALKLKQFAASNFTTFGGRPNRLQKIKLKRSNERHSLRNIFATWVGYRPYYGCTMAFRAEGKDRLLPFPSFLHETHDQWIAIVANMGAQMAHVEQATVTRRLHEDNTTPKKSRQIRIIFRARMNLLRAIFVALERRIRFQ